MSVIGPLEQDWKGKSRSQSLDDFHVYAQTTATKKQFPFVKEESESSLKYKSEESEDSSTPTEKEPKKKNTLSAKMKRGFLSVRERVGFNFWNDEGDVRPPKASSSYSRGAITKMNLVNSSSECESSILSTSPPPKLSFPSKNHIPRGFKLDDFEIGPLIGKGFFSEVRLVTLKSTQEKFALKTLKDIKTPDAKIAFMKEVELMNTLRHPNIVGFKGLFINSKGYHILLQYVPLGTLRKLLKDSSQEMPDLQRVRITMDIVKGMIFLHSKNVIHRDLKSKNCLMLTPEHVVISDFGLARILETGNSQVRSIAGSPYWMAPEMMRGEPYDKRADIFSFGIVLCEICTRLKAEPDALPRTRNYGLDVQLFIPLARKCPKKLVDIAIQCCEVNPSNRPSFEEILTELEKLEIELKGNENNHI